MKIFDQNQQTESRGLCKGLELFLSRRIFPRGSPNECKHSFVIRKRVYKGIYLNT